MKSATVLIAFLITSLSLNAQVVYPYEVKYFRSSLEGREVRIAYMDVPPSKANGKVVLLLHGKNFNGFYWKDVIKPLTEKGFRVIVPDQPGWGKSDKPLLHYSFHLLAQNTKSLLDTLHVSKTIVLGHSMGGMLAVRFALMFPVNTEKLILENPIGLEDYRLFVPYQALDKIYAKEKAATYESYKKYQQTYFPVWKPDYEQYVAAQAEQLKDPGFDSIAWVNAITYQMIYEQPTLYEWEYIRMPVLLIIGLEDRTIVGKDLLNENQKKQYGQYPILGKKAAQLMRARLIEIPGVGHIPHIQEREIFLKYVFEFI